MWQQSISSLKNMTGRICQNGVWKKLIVRQKDEVGKIQDEIEDRLAEEIVNGNIKNGDKVIVTTLNKKIHIEKG